jgi:hypothetical protein
MCKLNIIDHSLSGYGGGGKVSGAKTRGRLGEEWKRKNNKKEKKIEGKKGKWNKSRLSKLKFGQNGKRR